MEKIQRCLNVLWILIVCTALSTANWFEFVERWTPCSFCLFQRVAMTGMGLSALMNLRYGLRVEQYACSMLFALLGLFVSFRLNPFGPMFFGYHLSSLSSMVFVGSIVGEAFLLYLYSQTHTHDTHYRWGKTEKSLFLVLTLLVASNVFPLLEGLHKAISWIQ